MNTTEKTPRAAHNSTLITCAIRGLMSPMTKDIGK